MVPRAVDGPVEAAVSETGAAALLVLSAALVTVTVAVCDELMLEGAV